LTPPQLSSEQSHLLGPPARVSILAEREMPDKAPPGQPNRRKNQRSGGLLENNAEPTEGRNGSEHLRKDLI
jgi:hypothetical protein